MISFSPKTEYTHRRLVAAGPLLRGSLVDQNQSLTVVGIFILGCVSSEARFLIVQIRKPVETKRFVLLLSLGREA